MKLSVVVVIDEKRYKGELVETDKTPEEFLTDLFNKMAFKATVTMTLTDGSVIGFYKKVLERAFILVEKYDERSVKVEEGTSFVERKMPAIVVWLSWEIGNNLRACTQMDAVIKKAESFGYTLEEPIDTGEHVILLCSDGKIRNLGTGWVEGFTQMTGEEFMSLKSLPTEGTPIPYDFFTLSMPNRRSIQAITGIRTSYRVTAPTYAERDIVVKKAVDCGYTMVGRDYSGADTEILLCSDGGIRTPSLYEKIEPWVQVTVAELIKRIEGEKV